MGIHIMTDSASDIPQASARKWNIEVMPLHVYFGEESYLDGVDLMPEQFYEKLIETSQFPKTSQIPPFEYEESFRKAVERGDDVICITISSGVSGSFQSASLAADEVRDAGISQEIYVIDSRQFCISQGILVEEAVRLRDAGWTAAQIAEAITQLTAEAHVLAVFDTLEYLKLGGRISSAAAAVGNLLRIKPVVTITDGKVDVIGKARGFRNGGNQLIEFTNRIGGPDLGLPIMFGYTGTSDFDLRRYILESREKYGIYDESGIRIIAVGATVGTYAGPGAFAVAFFSKKAADILKKIRE